MDLSNLSKLAEETAAQRAASAAAAPSASSASAAHPEVGQAVYDALGHVLFKLQAGPNAAAGEDWTADEIEMELRLGAIVSGSRRLYARTAEKNVAHVLTGEEARARQLRFAAGVDECFARQLRQRLASRDFVAEVQPAQTVYCSADPSLHTRYLLVKEDTAQDVQFFRAEEKTRTLDLQLALLAFDYDLRLCGAKERYTHSRKKRDPHTHSQTHSHNTHTQEADDDGDLIAVARGASHTLTGDRFPCELVRTKKRTSYYLRNAARLWRIDLTEVVSSSLTGADKRVDFELELELEKSVQREWVGEREMQRMQALTAELASSLLTLLRRLVPCKHTLSEPSQALQRTELPPGNAAFNGLRRALLEANQGLRPSGHKMEFLGSMPINLYRKSLQQVENNAYFLTEKTDGVRFLLYTLRDEEKSDAHAHNALQSVLMNRDCVLSTLKGGERLASVLGEGCVLDGEVVFSLTLQRHVFLVFDLLSLHGTPLAHLSFAQRLQEMRELLNEDVVESFNTSLGEGEIALRCKQYFDKSEISTLIARFHEDKRDGERYFLDERGKPSHKTDGIIFQPDRAYVFGRSSELFKWKWSDMRSVDLGVAIMLSPAERITDCDTRHDGSIRQSNGVSPSAVHLWCGSRGGDRIDCTKRVEANVSLGPFDTLRMLAEYDERRTHVDRTRPIIAEVCYDTQVGMWTYVHVREDKAAPNAIEAVMGVFTEQVEAICIEELEFALLECAMDCSQSFEDLLQKCKSEIIRLQRNKKRSRE